jgi:hypothetical protein
MGRATLALPLVLVAVACGGDQADGIHGKSSAGSRRVDGCRSRRVRSEPTRALMHRVLGTVPAASCIFADKVDEPKTQS